ncbi:hypothetical protein [Gordonia westfalica]|uniref:Uncharacterized protein n=1 Tax=Gordonia westfalica TaxID=158898 RepID=A0A1H2DNX4_9ACTN|nr:hypothetical protein [Gordonia westfalica]SDT84496.1 hypothetical protein SAMN04488548_10926 [Gordonia westfalica]
MSRYEYRVVPRDGLNGLQLWELQRRLIWRDGSRYTWNEWMVFRDYTGTDECPIAWEGVMAAGGGWVARAAGIHQSGGIGFRTPADKAALKLPQLQPVQAVTGTTRYS